MLSQRLIWRLGRCASPTISRTTCTAKNAQSMTRRFDRTIAKHCALITSTTPDGIRCVSVRLKGRPTTCLPLSGSHLRLQCAGVIGTGTNFSFISPAMDQTMNSSHTVMKRSAKQLCSSLPTLSKRERPRSNKAHPEMNYFACTNTGRKRPNLSLVRTVRLRRPAAQLLRSASLCTLQNRGV
jgi:hypothetical protein